MSEIVLPEKEEEEEEEELKYQATEEDEEKFFLMYHFNWGPSEVDLLSEDRRKWLIARLVGQKQMEREMMQQQRIASRLGDFKGAPDLRVT